MRKPHPDDRRRIHRPWVVPPGLLLLNEPFEGFNVLDETRSELGVLLWQSLRYVDLWSLALSRLNRDWRYYGLAHLGLANLHMQRGDAPRARVRLLRALRASRRYGLWSVRSMVLHDLFCITATGDHAEHAEMYARAAFRSYGRRHPRLPVLAHDVARYWMSRGHYARAFETFRAVLPHLTRASDRLLAWANLAQAAGGSGDVEAFNEAWARVWRMVDSGSDLDRVAEAMINVAVGAAALGQWVRQELAASYALQVAKRRSEAQQRLKAEELLEAARKAGMGRRAPEEPAPVPEFSEASGQLAEELVAALSEAWES